MPGDADILNMSDEDFLKNPPTPSKVEKPEAKTEVEADKTAGETTKVEETSNTEVKEEGKEKSDQTEVIESQTETDKTKVEPKAQPEATDPNKDAANKDNAQPVQKAPAKDASVKVPVEDGDKTKEAPKEQDKAQTVQAESPNYEAFYKKVMAPFKANGRTLELKTPEEVIQLMQQGANYTKKMQDLVPQRRVLTMLQNNGLMDEGKLSYLIDLDKKNPEAIKKLIKDAGINPTEIDPDVEPAYRAGNHRVSDDEVGFQTALEDMQSTPERLETLKVINAGWDQASKEALWKSPEIMSVIHEQRENGIYDRIATEVVRRQTLGVIPGTVPFLQAYKVVGDQMMAAKAFDDLNVKPAAKAAPITTRVEPQKESVTNNDRAAAAAPSRTAIKASKPPQVNILAMSDEEFLKQPASAFR